ncbi:MAG: 1-aminocyclopropane-1-carboxylate deaminase [Pseudomonadales bacterium]|nr:1-aminocyclopropane-1-carboxylate deaminase [Pseudomonadales bacterium]
MPLPLSILEQLLRWEQELDNWPPLQPLLQQRALPVEPLRHPEFQRHGVSVEVLRGDRLHPLVSGNKWFKLKYNLLAARRQRSPALLSFGGPWSNHLHALAAVARLLDWPLRGVVRGEEHHARSTPMLREASAWGMRVETVNRHRYRQLRGQPDLVGAAAHYVIPEGGDNWWGLLGAASMALAISGDPQRFSHVLAAVGTGCTLAGLRLGLPAGVEVLGISALKGAWQLPAMERRMAQLPGPPAPWHLSLAHHRGGFAVADPALLSFMAEFSDNTGLPLEPVYTGKAMLALLDYLARGIIPSGSRVLFVHSGGLQGQRGFRPPESTPNLSR